jgi:thioredoxin reductase (NADPH)
LVSSKSKNKPKKVSKKGKEKKNGTLFKKEDKKDKWFIPEDSRKALLERFKELKDTVHLEVFIKEGENDPYNTLSVVFCSDLSRLSDKIVTTVNVIGEEKSKQYDVTNSPSILFNPDEYNIRYTGAPAGEEGKSFVETILMVSKGESGLTKESKEALAELEESRHLMVFITPDCPYCPGQVINAFRAAVERPDLVSAECVESIENIELAKTYDVGAVPHTVVNSTTMSKGLQQEEMFILELLTLEPTAMSQEILDETADDTHGKPTTEVDVIIIGAGPAGLTAGIYAKRSGLSAVVLEKDMVGGLVAVTPVVENYPGFTNIAGKRLMDMISSQAKDYVDIYEGEELSEIKIGKKVEAYTNRGKYIGDGLIFATGAKYRKLGVPGEETFAGHGVSYCATCDGYFFKDKKVLMVGGGNSALTDALHLKNLGAHVAIVHRRDKFRAEKYLQESIEREKIPVIWDSVVDEILGNKKTVTGVKIINQISKETKIHKVDGVFIAIGEVPNSKLAGELGIKLKDDGFVDIDNHCRTNIPRIYAAGDVTGGIRQIVTAVSEGATAALAAFEDLANPYWLKGLEK